MALVGQHTLLAKGCTGHSAAISISLEHRAQITYKVYTTRHDTHPTTRIVCHEATSASTNPWLPLVGQFGYCRRLDPCHRKCSATPGGDAAAAAAAAFETKWRCCCCCCDFTSHELGLASGRLRRKPRWRVLAAAPAESATAAPGACMEKRLPK